MSESQDAKPSQRCCLGLLYYSQALEDEGKRPVCVGLPHTPSHPIHIEQQKHAAEVNDFKFACLGHALYDRASKAEGSSSGRSDTSASSSNRSRGTLPYCEGLEVILGSHAAAVAKAADAGVVAHAAADRPPDDLAAVLSSMFGGDESPIVRGAAKFNKIATRNWERMKTTAGQAYSMTIKQLIDKLSGDQ